MNPNDQQAEDDIDYNALYGGEEIEESTEENTKESNLLNDIGTNVKDYLKQGAKGLLIGAGGTWGDLAELAGINPKEQSMGSQARNKIESDALERMEQPGYKPSMSDIILTQSDDDLAPRLNGLPTSRNLEDVNAMVGGPDEDPQTLGGRLGKRQGRIIGSGAAFGSPGVLTGLAAGVAGQGVEEAGGGPLLQGAAEIATILLGSRSGKSALDSSKGEVEKKINDLRKLGYTDQEITLAINSQSGGKVGKISASKGSATEKAFEGFADKSQELITDILAAEVPGIEHGTKYVHQMASDAYGQVAKNASNLVIKDSTPFINSATGVVREIRKNLGKNPEAETFLKRLADAVVESTKSPTAENFMNFYKELNNAGNWMVRSQKDRLLTQVKEGIKDTFKAEGKAGRALADEFETANRGIRKAYLAEDVHDIIQKATTQDGINFTQLRKTFDKPQNVKLFEDVLGKTQTNNVKMITNVGKEIKDFDKSWKVVNNLSPKDPINIVAGTGAAYYLYNGDMKGLAKALSLKAGGMAVRKISEKMLTDPKYQNLMIRGLHAIQRESPKLYRSANDAMQKYLDEEGIPID